MYSFTDMWYLFISENCTPSTGEEINCEGFLPQRKYYCDLQAYYDGHKFLSLNKTIETDLGSEYITYMYM